ncbi:MAG: hypothetical protein IIC21_08300 [Chloroflexi bacterium]|nr:hypothetical protein [Chloroflexota bacterium]
MRDNKIAVGYDRKLHAGSEWVKIDQGRYAAEPLALPKNWSNAYQKVMEAFMPSQNTPVLAQFLRDALPKRLETQCT